MWRSGANGQTRRASFGALTWSADRQICARLEPASRFGGVDEQGPRLTPLEPTELALRIERRQHDSRSSAVRS
jgi:hypothetical protein